jgi:hypothetical protein
LNGGYSWLEVECRRCETRSSLPLDAIRRPRDTPIWKLEAALKCRSCRTPRYSPPVHMIRLNKEQEIAPCVWGIQTMNVDGCRSFKRRRSASVIQVTVAAGALRHSGRTSDGWSGLA